ncbi:MAG: deoxyribodipyrimidine photo-lyase [Proteobacteria bacterium]|nr:deoxyribodipyrimidine photo-lyase [Pseudomonadota bacterium]
MLRDRISTIKEGPDNSGSIVYWMSRDQRIEDNWALIYSQELALRKNAPLAVVFCIAPGFLDAALRQYNFLLTGLKELQWRLKELNVPFFLLTGDPGTAILKFVNDQKVSALVTDFDPLRIKRGWKNKVAQNIKIPFFEVDAHNIVPCTIVSQKAEYGAYTIRKKIQRALPLFMDAFPFIQKHPFTWMKVTPPIEWDVILNSLKINRSVKDADWIAPGEHHAHKALERFIEEKLEGYETGRNNPSRHGQSGLSPYLHFGQLSAQRVVLEVEKSCVPVLSKNAFLEELIVRRELSDNYCFYNHNYDRFEGFPGWAQKTLNMHRQDMRSYIYSREVLEDAATHDKLWNAAQKEMVKCGKMHGYMRMYWAKKILEWTNSPEEAMSVAIYLNDKYELDGRDPNGYAGIAWSIGGVHDRAWNERVIFGKIRYMSYNGCKSKFNIKEYIDRGGGL